MSGLYQNFVWGEVVAGGVFEGVFVEDIPEERLRLGAAREVFTRLTSNLQHSGAKTILPNTQTSGLLDSDLHPARPIQTS